jgi:hypothetical protein
VWLFAVTFPLLFMAFGLWAVHLGIRSWNGNGVRPSTSIEFSAGSSARVRRFVDRCIIPLGLFYLSLGVTLGLVGVDASLNLSAGGALGAASGMAAGIGAAMPVALLVLTVSLCRFWKPRRLIPAYLRFDAHKVRSEAGNPVTSSVSPR